MPRLLDVHIVLLSDLDIHRFAAVHDMNLHPFCNCICLKRRVRELFKLALFTVIRNELPNLEKQRVERLSEVHFTHWSAQTSSCEHWVPNSNGDVNNVFSCLVVC